jgi:hypothetical protein
MSGVPEVGTLYYGGYVNGLKVWTQPGGPGTIVFPQVPSQFPTQFQGYPQTPMSYPAQYYPPCSHPSNCLELQEIYDPATGNQVMLLLCPQCSFVIQIYNPASLYYDYVENPIVIA